MVAKPDREPASGSSSPDPGRGQQAQTGTQTGDIERYGPLRIERPGKADGRALILFSRAERPRA